jgi:hypothetical protein
MVPTGKKGGKDGRGRISESGQGVANGSLSCNMIQQSCSAQCHPVSPQITTSNISEKEIVSWTAHSWSYHHGAADDICSVNLFFSFFPTDLQSVAWDGRCA